MAKLLKLGSFKAPSFVMEALSWASPVLVALVCIGYAASLLSRLVSLLSRDFIGALDKILDAIVAPILNPAGQGAVIVGGILFLLASFMVSKRLGMAIGLGSFMVVGTMGLLYAVFSLSSGRAIGLGDVIYAVLLTGLSIQYLFYSALRAFLLSDPLALALIVLLANALGLMAAWLDSPKVNIDGSRIPERRLLLYAVLGGGGGVIAGALLSHNDRIAGGLLIKLIAYTCISYALLLSMLGPSPG